MIKFILIVLFLLNSCGDSPFLDDLTEDNNKLNPLEVRTSDLIFKSLEMEGKLFWRNGPILFDESSLLFILTERGIPKNASLKVWLWMPDPSMNHGSWPIQIEKISEGVYELKELFFTMEGRWDIHFEVSKNGVTEELIWSLDL